MFSEFIWSFLFWLFVAATLVQLSVWWFFFRKLEIGNWKLMTREFPISNLQFPISIIICARNEAYNLRRYLPKILEQQYTGIWEVIVVDDASEDETPAVLQFFQKKNPRLRVLRIVEKKQAGKKHALAQGIAAAQFDQLLLTDADCEPASAYWLTHMAAALGKKPETEIVLGYGPVNPTPDPSPTGRGDIERPVEDTSEAVAVHSTPPLPVGEGSGVGLTGAEVGVHSWSRFENAHTAIQYFALALAGMPYMGVGRNLAFKRQAYERAGGFSAHSDLPSGDDDLLVNAAATAENTAICLHPESFMFSESKKTWREWMRQKQRHLTAGRRYRPLHQAVLTLLSLSHILHYFLFVTLILSGSGMVSVVLLYLARSCSLLYLYGRILPTLREFHLLSQVPIYDTLLAAYYGAFVPLSLIAPSGARSAWK